MGGAIVVVLFAALIVPFFINWDSYRANFEHEASRVLGHPVHVGGASHVSILPSPSVTFTDVEVGDPGAEPLMTIQRFSATLELVPLLQGQLHVDSMTLEHPVVHVTAGANGTIDWMQRLADTQKLDPDRVSLADVQVKDGSVTFRDAGTGVGLAFEQVNGDVSATSLAGPWRIDGTYMKDGSAVPFHLATGRRLDNGTIRLQAQVSPAELPVAATTDGVLAVDPVQGVTYAGTYSFASANDASANATDGNASGADAGTVAAPSGWSSDGSFMLSREKLVIDKAVLSEGPADRATSIAGSLTVGFGTSARFDATGTASQLDLDSALGGGPTAPVNVSAATEQFLGWLSGLPSLPIPGRIAINIPAIIVGGSVVQGVDFSVEPGAAGWKVEGLSADLPGQAHVEADGVLSSGKQPGFAGHARLAVNQPAAFAAWWRGSDATSGGVQLPAFDVAGDAEISPGLISLQNINATVGDAKITGRFDWNESARDHSRHLGTDLKANRIDVDQLRALVSLVAGRDVANASALADSYSIILAADEFTYAGVSLKGVAVNANYADDVLNIVQLAVADLGGTSLKVTSGRIESLTSSPRGHLDAHVEAMSLDGLSGLAGKLLPASGLSEWLARTGPALAPAVLDVRVSGPADQARSGFTVGVKGVAGETTVDATLSTDAQKIADWRSAISNVAVTLDSPDTQGLAKQFGLAAADVANDPGTHLVLSGKGNASAGLDATFDAELPGLALSG
ncbi:MAG TPA: AsmA family protein, partial [Lacunisphaera sp.]|nr:AsmA family protein [Lacunisphaera sp.]